MTQDSDSALPCPYCGKDPTFNEDTHWMYARCVPCNESFQLRKPTTLPKLISKWNGRWKYIVDQFKEPPQTPPKPKHTLSQISAMAKSNEALGRAPKRPKWVSRQDQEFDRRAAKSD